MGTGQIKLSCSCPDWADMCKHVAAVLYGVGARLDHKPQLLFVLRGVDENELIAGAGSGLALPKATPGRAKMLDEGDVAAVFGLEMDDSAATGTSEADAPVAARQPLRPKTRKQAKSPKSRKASSNAAVQNPRIRILPNSNPRARRPQASVPPAPNPPTQNLRASSPRRSG